MRPGALTGAALAAAIALTAVAEATSASPPSTAERPAARSMGLRLSANRGRLEGRRIEGTVRPVFVGAESRQGCPGYRSSGGRRRPVEATGPLPCR